MSRPWIPFRSEKKNLVDSAAAWGLLPGTMLLLKYLSTWSELTLTLGVDRIPGHPASVDALVALTDDVIATGSEDGMIRVMQILPNKFCEHSPPFSSSYPSNMAIITPSLPCLRISNLSKHVRQPRDTRDETLIFQWA